MFSAIHAVGDVFGDGAAEEDGFLGDDADLFAQAFDGELADVDVVDEDLSGGGVEDAWDEGEEGGFAAAVGTDERDGLAELDGEGDAIEGGGVRAGVGEVDVAELDRGAVGRHGGEAGLVAGFGDGGFELPEAVGGGGALLNVVDEPGEGPEGGSGHSKGAEDDDHGFLVELAVEDGFDRDEGHDADGDDGDDLNEGACEGACGADLVELAEEVAVGVVEDAELPGFGGVNLDDAEALEAFESGA